MGGTDGLESDHGCFRGWLELGMAGTDERGAASHVHVRNSHAKHVRVHHRVIYHRVVSIAGTAGGCRHGRTVAKSSEKMDHVL